MKKIHIFIASSKELEEDRLELVDLFQDLETQDVAYIPIKWEYLDSSMRAERKEDEYLEKLRECEICLVLFWHTLGDYTKEELNVAIAEMKKGRMPQKVYVLFKEPGNDISEELHRFKEELPYIYPRLTVYNFENTKKLRDIVEGILNHLSFS